MNNQKVSSQLFVPMRFGAEHSGSTKYFYKIYPVTVIKWMFLFALIFSLPLGLNGIRGVYIVSQKPETKPAAIIHRLDYLHDGF